MKFKKTVKMFKRQHDDTEIQCWQIFKGKRFFF